MQYCLSQHTILVRDCLEDLAKQSLVSKETINLASNFVRNPDIVYMEGKWGNSGSKNEHEDGDFYRNARNLFNVFILHDPLVNKLILTMLGRVIEDAQANPGCL